MSKDFKGYLFDMLGRTDRILANTGTITRQQDLESEHWLQDAIIRNLEVIGEAAKNIPDWFCEQHPEIPWKEIKGTRDRLIHQYSEVSTPIIWDILQNELPALKTHLTKIISEFDDINSP